LSASIKNNNTKMTYKNKLRRFLKSQNPSLNPSLNPMTQKIHKNRTL
jgi:hypothetical protein